MTIRDYITDAEIDQLVAVGSAIGGSEGPAFTTGLLAGILYSRKGDLHLFEAAMNMFDGAYQRAKEVVASGN